VQLMNRALTAGSLSPTCVADAVVAAAAEMDRVNSRWPSFIET